MKTINTNKKGFTIIEVVLVLAIAGLIFMMVFIALPALQRSQRDTQRSTDISRVVTALNNYQASNRGAIPTTGTYIAGHTDASKTTGANTSASNINTWAYFYDNYLIVNAGGGQDTFADPDGGLYSLWIKDCNPSANTAGTPCNNAAQRFNVTFDAQSNGQLAGESNITIDNSANAGAERGHSILIVKHATCNGESSQYSTGARKVAVLYKKEGGGTFCVNN
jgi:prepilin-type N-terminal cleavage/methylation domain-containing protein